MPQELTTLLPGEAEQDDPLLDRVVGGIREIALRKGLEYYLEVGQYLIDEFFDGDFEHYAKRGKKHTSFRALANHPDLPMSYVTLHYAVRVRRQIALLPDDVRGALTFSHHKALLALRDEKARVSLARKAVDKKWTLATLKAEVSKRIAKERASENRGRTPLPRFEKTLNLFARTIAKDDAFDDLDSIGDLEPEKAQALHSTVLDIETRCNELKEALRKQIPGFELPDQS